MFTFNYKDSAGFTEEEVHAVSSKLAQYIRFLNEVTHRIEYDGNETSINLPYDESLKSEVARFVAGLKTSGLKYVFVVGIGGSNLGPMAVYHALHGTFTSAQSDHPQLVFLDTVSPTLHLHVRRLIDENITDKSNFYISLVSKSGSTTETIANFEVLYDYLSEKFGDVYDRVIVTTGLGSELWNKSANKNYKKIDHRNVGGRFSIMSPVGQVPLLLSGIDVDGLLMGAQEARDVCLSEAILENPAAVSAILQFSHNKKGIRTNDNFFFNPELESLGKWYRQLMAESLGKEFDLDGNKVHSGITPLVSIGSTDLHSMVQLYLSGPRHIFTNFVYAAQDNADVILPESHILDDMVAGIEGKNMATIMSAIYEGTKKAYMKNDRPFMEIVLPDLSAKSLGQYMQFKMFEIMYLGKLLHVNVFDQPKVEDYKVETRALLEA